MKNGIIKDSVPYEFVEGEKECINCGLKIDCGIYKTGDPECIIPCSIFKVEGVFERPEVEFADRRQLLLVIEGDEGIPSELQEDAVAILMNHFHLSKVTAEDMIKRSLNRPIELYISYDMKETVCAVEHLLYQCEFETRLYGLQEE